ncbi:MAG: hypothetical protein Q9187_004146 [Circinaria calcarea]
MLGAPIGLIDVPGYFSLNHTRMATMSDFFGQLWKEYALSDSRYLTSDPFVLTMETTTAKCHRNRRSFQDSREGFEGFERQRKLEKVYIVWRSQILCMA